MRRVVPALAAAVLFAACSDQSEAPFFEPPSTAVTPAGSADRYIVVLDQAPDGDAAGVNRIAGQLQVAPVDVYEWAVAGFSADLTPDRVAELERSPLVRYVEKDQIFTINGTQSPTPSWGLDRIDQTNLPLDNSYTYPNQGGAGVTVYVFDTGLNFGHNDFTGRTGGGFNAVGGGAPNDQNGHGTHTTGTTAGSTYGVAKLAAPIEPVQVCNQFGSCPTSAITGGLNWAIADHGAGPAVGNMSLGGGASSTLDNAVANAVADGIFMAVSAGNSNISSCLQSPARAPTAHTVGSTTITDARSGFSNFGTCNDIFAPGSSITSAYIGGSNASAVLSGTSMASPHAAGVAALYLGQNPGDTPAQVDAALKANASVGKISNVGAGSPNLLLNMDFLNGGGPPPGDNPPMADWSVTCVGQTCTFDASTSTDDNGIVSWEWLLNGSVVRTGEIIQHTFPGTQTLTITLRVTDTVGQQDTNTQTNTYPVSGPPPPTDNPPMASWSVSCAGPLCTFDGSASSDDNGIVLYEWLAGGVVRATGVTTQFTFNSPRTVTVTLRVTDTIGQQDTDVQTVTLPN